MSTIFNVFIDALSNGTNDLYDFTNIIDKSDYLNRLGKNILSGLVIMINSVRPSNITCYFLKTNIIYSDINEDMKYYIIKINSNYYVIKECTYDINTKRMYYTLSHSVNNIKEHEKISVYFYQSIGDKLHQYSSLLYIERNLNKYDNILKSIINVNNYDDGIYENNTYISNIMNSGQMNAIMSISNNLEIIHGPPGTGKSTTIIELIKMKIPKSHKILCTAVQNRAIETIVLKLIKNNMSFTVIGNEKRLKEYSKKYLLYNEFENNEHIIRINNKIDKYQKRLIVVSDIEKMNKYEDRILSLHKDKNTIKQNIASKYDIFVTTVNSSTQIYNFIDKINTIIIDEAGYLTEMNLIPILRLNPNNLIFIGDHKQLQPFNYAHATESSNVNYYLSFLERAIKERKHFVLNIQYRMDTIICNLVSSLFYNNNLKPNDNHNDKYDSAIEHHNVNGNEIHFENSFYNMEEIEHIAELCKTYKNEEILILTFYNKQLEKLKDVISSKNITLCSVDSSQGMESDIVIVSLVRTKFSKFMCNENRVCVMLSRARHKLIFVGNISILSECSPIWKYIDNYIVKSKTLSKLHLV